MKPRFSLIPVAWIAAFSVARASAPIVQPVAPDSVILGQTMTLQASATDPDGNLVSATFYVSGPATRDLSNLDAISWPGFQTLGTVGLSGAQGTPQINWQPPQAGTYLVEVVVANQSTQTTVYGYFETVTGRLTVAPQTVPAGVNKMILYPGEIKTQENDTSSQIVAQSGANLIFWSGGRVVLTPGFHAANGSFFWAAVDHGMNGYSDVEKSTSTAGDKLPDAWKVDHGLSIGTAYTDPSYMSAYLGGYSPGDHAGTAQLPTGYQLVLKTPSNGYYAVNTGTWSITSVANP